MDMLEDHIKLVEAQMYDLLVVIRKLEHRIELLEAVI